MVSPQQMQELDQNGNPSDITNVVRWLSFQGCAFRGYDENSGSKNRGNFLELLSLLESYDEKVEDVLKSTPQNSSYTSSTIQKEILQIYASRIRNVICEEIGDRKFNIILALVAAAREVFEVHQFFKDLFDIVNITSASSKRHNELQKAQAGEITRLVSINELATGTRMNQIGTLQSPVLGITDNLCQALQHRSQDILNAISLVLTTKDLIQKLKDDGWNELLKNVISFLEHHYRVDIFFDTIDAQLQELKSRFNEHVVNLLTLTTALDPKEFFKLFDIDKICILVNKFYREDFSQQEKERLLYELKNYELDVCKHPGFRKISTLSELCRSLVESGKSVMYPLVDRLISLILALPVSIVSSKRVFSTMNIVKTRLCSKMEDDFFKNFFCCVH
uniref:HAT C-terminal dimerisation domain-containing protein n=1 Tax=Gossypium raimondii TaxID=29730 RepID=A0A0D2UWB1_GOSRA|nr:hypothetical protein B456_011G216300 [Gossypium raimondii]